MGSRSDLETMRAAATTLQELGVAVRDAGRLRAPHARSDVPLRSDRRAHAACASIIAGAGGAAHLPGMVATKTKLPVIGVPVESHALKGLDSLLSIAQMPAGVPVATMAIGGAANAALYAARILALDDAALAKRLEERVARIARGRKHDPVTSGRSGSSAAASSAGCSRSKRSGWAIVSLRSSRFPIRRAVKSPTSRSSPPTTTCARSASWARAATSSPTSSRTSRSNRCMRSSATGGWSSERERVAHRRKSASSRRRSYARTGSQLRDFAPVAKRTPNSRRRERTLGFPAVLKTTTGGYDGKGQWVVRSSEQARCGACGGERRAVDLGTLIPFDRELSIIAARDVRDEIVTFPVSENVHDHGVLATTIVPARVPDRTRTCARHARSRSRRALGIVGRIRRRVLFERRRRAARERDRPARPQQRPLFARRHPDLAVRDARARDLRAAAGRTALLARRA